MSKPKETTAHYTFQEPVPGKHNYKRDALLFYAAFVLFLFLIPGLAWLVLIPALVATWRAVRQRNA